MIRFNRRLYKVVERIVDWKLGQNYYLNVELREEKVENIDNRVIFIEERVRRFILCLIGVLGDWQKKM